ncbi:ABCB27 [Symbiodinium necroappetens]|uniref:ABCB27 protein n=1 Tax=Symbiodinium necroappetens TaxID=1628268 RepID=A0A812L5B7_9DINO|nr:ABCB27 [Symbiodinium necroappetens]|mmetsp:Transcript_78838/g.189208  ORF Transcript_78838/g.189208 Transcript_78838/m.189208 type:complete len:134 (-) Transcript_78838:343-744(-)
MASERPRMPTQIQREPQLQQRRISLPCLSFKSSQDEPVKDGGYSDSKELGDTGVRGRLTDSSKVKRSSMASSTSPTVSPPSSSSRSRSSSPASFWSECEEDESGRSRTPSPCLSEDGSYIYQYSVIKVKSADF